LAGTLTRKNKALDNLHDKSPSLKKTLQPRMAYKIQNNGQSLTSNNFYQGGNHSLESQVMAARADNNRSNVTS